MSDQDFVGQIHTCTLIVTLLWSNLGRSHQEITGSVHHLILLDLFGMLLSVSFEDIIPFRENMGNHSILEVSIGNIEAVLALLTILESTVPFE